MSKSKLQQVPCLSIMRGNSCFTSKFLKIGCLDLVRGDETNMSLEKSFTLAFLYSLLFKKIFFTFFTFFTKMHKVNIRHDTSSYRRKKSKLHWKRFSVHRFLKVMGSRLLENCVDAKKNNLLGILLA